MSKTKIVIVPSKNLWPLKKEPYQKLGILSTDMVLFSLPLREVVFNLQVRVCQQGFTYSLKVFSILLLLDAMKIATIDIMSVGIDTFVAFYF